MSQKGKQKKSGNGGSLPAKAVSVPVRRIEGSPLLDQLLHGRLALARKQRHQRAFFRNLRRAAADPEFIEMVQRFRDTILRSALKREDQSKGLTIALAGTSGGEGSSLFSVLLALSLGASPHHRVAFLDGRFNVQRFNNLSNLLDLSRNSCTIRKGGESLLGYYNQIQPNVFFLKSTIPEQSLEFFSDKQLRSFLASLRSQFDFTVIDMPPLLTASSNVFVVPAVDRLYLVVSAGVTRLSEVGRCMNLAEEAQTEISGVVINNQRSPLWSKLLWKEYFF